MDYLITVVTGGQIHNPPEWLAVAYYGVIVGLVKLTADSITGALIERGRDTKCRQSSR